MGMAKEFREFAVKGNVVDMAVGVVIGAAFGKIVASLVNDIIMPLVSLLMGGVDFTRRAIIMDRTSRSVSFVSDQESIDAAAKAGAAVLRYGTFAQTVLDFLIVAFAIFLAIEAVNRLRGPQPVPAAAPAPAK